MTKAVRLGAVADAPSGSLSGGQRKPLWLGRAPMAGPRVILRDGAGAGVAPARFGRLADLIAALAAERGITVLLIGHALRLVARLASHVVVMADGRILAAGPMEALRRDPRVLAAHFGDREEEAAA